jgi:hypothetical protein
MEDYYDEDYEDEESEPMVLSFGNDGKAEIKMASDLKEQEENQSEIINEFIRQNLELFKEFLDKNNCSEEDFNNGKKINFVNEGVNAE